MILLITGQWETVRNFDLKVIVKILLGEKLNTIKRLCLGISVFSAIIFFYEAQEIPKIS